MIVILYILIGTIGAGCIGMGVTMDKNQKWFKIFFVLAWLGFFGMGLACLLKYLGY